MTKYYPPTTLFGENQTLSGPEIKDFLAGKQFSPSTYAYVGDVDPNLGSHEINQQIFDLNLEWYKCGCPGILATDSTIWKSVEIGLAVLEQKSELTKFYHLAQLPVNAILFPHESTLDYELPESIIADRSNGRYRYYRTLPEFCGLPIRSLAGIFDLSWFPEKSIVESDLAQSDKFFTEVFLLGLSFALVEEKIPNLRDLVNPS